MVNHALPIWSTRTYEDWDYQPKPCPLRESQIWWPNCPRWDKLLRQINPCAGIGRENYVPASGRSQMQALAATATT